VECASCAAGNIWTDLGRLRIKGLSARAYPGCCKAYQPVAWEGEDLPVAGSVRSMARQRHWNAQPRAFNRSTT
jgi:hypothetical protein